MKYKVVIVGAGPTGLALGAELKRLGISSLILDRLEAGANTSRAAAIHARTLEVLEPLGVTADLLREGLIIPTLHVRDRDHILANLSFKGLKTRYPFVLACSQARTEALLLEKLRSLGGDVQRPCEVIAISPGEQSVQVQFRTSKELKTVETEWLVGCDGMHSLVRQQAHISYAGGEYKEAFVLADVEMDWPFGRGEGNLFLSKEGLVAVIPLPGAIFRIIATVTHSSPSLGISDFEQLLKERGPESPTDIHRMIWASRFHIEHHVASVMRKGRILLAGDAAHVHSPAGGQGMNTGIQDAIALAAALREGSEEALESWQKKRLEIAHSVVKLTDRLTKVVAASSPGARLVRNLVIRLVARIPFIEHALVRKLAELDIKSSQQ